VASELMFFLPLLIVGYRSVAERKRNRLKITWGYASSTDRTTTRATAGGGESRISQASPLRAKRPFERTELLAGAYSATVSAATLLRLP
jgi:hypothetical protein